MVYVPTPTYLVPNVWGVNVKITVSIDSRERTKTINRAAIIKSLFTQKNSLPYFINKSIEFDPQIVQLPIGDIICGSVSVEIKTTPSDLISSALDERLKNQAMNMSSNYEHQYLILLFTNDEFKSYCTKVNKNPNMYLGLLASLEARNNIHIKKYTKLPDAIDDLSLIFIKANDGKETAIDHNPQRIQASTSDEQIRILTGYPMISYDRAKNLLTHFGSLNSIFNASEKDLLQVDGIGKKIAQKFIEVNHKDYI